MCERDVGASRAGKTGAAAIFDVARATMTQPLLPGDMAPWFTGEIIDTGNQFLFDKIAGRPILMLFLGSSTWPGSLDALKVVAANRALFDENPAAFFGFTIDPADASEKRLVPQRPGIRFMIDRDRKISTAYRAILGEGPDATYTPQWILLDEMLRVIATAPLNEGEAIVARLRAHLAEGWAPPAPLLVVPRVFEPEMCRQLMQLYDTQGGQDSGFMNEVGGKTVAQLDHAVKKRADCFIEDPALQQALGARIARFLKPAIQRAFQFEVTHVERFLVACYDDRDGGGHFRAHRDDTTSGTAHRRFACTINLNAEEYEGGDLRFPEYGKALYRAPTGGAIIFSCSVLHEVLPVTRGRRFAFLPFLHDEAAQVVREQNMSKIVELPRDRTAVA